ncbi:MAG: hypothetical protein J0H98_08075 [Solirubrobacterales bacterium]|nr:hypothetical protein [Solirubrobacterales bacterium]
MSEEHSGEIIEVRERDVEVVRAFRYDGLFHLEMLDKDQRVGSIPGVPGGCQITVAGEFRGTPPDPITVRPGNWVVSDPSGLNGLKVMSDQEFNARFVPVRGQMS